jgi:aminoglycoside 6-adenylyltransferase
MRTEQDIFELILNTAIQDERIRAVILNGSRANPNAKRDFFQDFDIVYIVRDVNSLKNDPHWIDRFGELMILQTPEDMGIPSPANHGNYAYLMQFMDGNRIDLTLYPVSQLEALEKDSLSILLLDKDGLIEPFPPPSEDDYLPKPPSAKEYADCCNEFWWICPYIAKGLWRQEITYAKHMHHYAHNELMKMLAWNFSVQSNFQNNPGKFGKNLQSCLQPEMWQMLVQTYADASYKNTWQALFASTDLFRIISRSVAEFYGYPYPEQDDRRVTAHLHHVKKLPQDAEVMYP